MKGTTVFDCTLIEMDKHHSDQKGNITVVENGKTIPFNVKRASSLQAEVSTSRWMTATSNVRSPLTVPTRDCWSFPVSGGTLTIFQQDPFVWFWLRKNMTKQTTLGIMKIFLNGKK